MDIPESPFFGTPDRVISPHAKGIDRWVWTTGYTNLGVVVREMARLGFDVDTVDVYPSNQHNMPCLVIVADCED